MKSSLSFFLFSEKIFKSISAIFLSTKPILRFHFGHHSAKNIERNQKSPQELFGGLSSTRELIIMGSPRPGFPGAEPPGRCRFQKHSKNQFKITIFTQKFSILIILTKTLHFFQKFLKPLLAEYCPNI